VLIRPLQRVQRGGPQSTFGNNRVKSSFLDAGPDEYPIARDLLLGPKRYRDCSRACPEISTTLLAARLRELEAAGIVARRTLPPPAASSVYELTDAGLVHGAGHVRTRTLRLPLPRLATPDRQHASENALPRHARRLPPDRTEGSMRPTDSASTTAASKSASPTRPSPSGAGDPSLMPPA
jgi:HxlR-like helix-turn-helix